MPLNLSLKKINKVLDRNEKAKQKHQLVGDIASYLVVEAAEAKLENRMECQAPWGNDALLHSVRLCKR